MVALYERVGGEFLVNTVTSNDQEEPTITALSSGGFVVSWTDSSGEGGDASGSSIKAQIFDATGAKVGGEFLINSTTSSYQAQPTITSLASGGFVVSWTDSSGQGGDIDSPGIKAQIFNASGAKVGTEFLVNSVTSYQQVDPTITSLSSGGFVVSWTDDSHQGGDNDGSGIKAQIFDATGAKVGTEFLVNSVAWDQQVDPTITSLSSGGFVVCWVDPSGQGGDDYFSAIKAQIFDAAGAKVGTEFLVNTTILGPQQEPTTTSLSSGGFVVSWRDNGTIKAQIFDVAGAKVGTEFLVNTTTLAYQKQPTITSLPSGGFVVSWIGDVGQFGNPYESGIKAQIFDASGAKVGPEFLVDTLSSNYHLHQTITALSSGALVVSWIDFDGQGWDAGGNGVKAQIFAPSAGPKDIGLSNMVVSETELENRTVASFSTQEVNSNPVYTLVSDSSGGAFRIENDRLVIADNSRLDFESSPQVSITVQATDENGHSYQEEFTLQIEDVAIESRYSAGNEFLVNTATLNQQMDATITSLASGGFVASWMDLSGQGGDASGSGVKAQIFDATGAKVGGEFLVNTITSNDQQEPTITSLSSGGFVVTWADRSGQGGDASIPGIKAQIFDATGAKIGAEFLVNSVTSDRQEEPAITSLPSGGFVVSWTDHSNQGGDTELTGIKAQIFNAAGAKIGTEFLVNSQTSGLQQHSAITSLASGGFVVSWEEFSSQGSDTSYMGIKAQIFDAAGAKVGAEFLVNTETLDYQQQPAITSLPSGGFVISWTDSSGEGGDAGYGIKAQIFDPAGAKVGGEFLVNTTTLGSQVQPTITSLPSGGFVVSWTDDSGEGGDASYSGVKAQIFDANGAKVGNEFLVNTITSGHQAALTITSLSSGAFVVGWLDSSGQGGDASGSGIKAEIFTPIAGNTGPVNHVPAAQPGTEDVNLILSGSHAISVSDNDGDTLTVTLSVTHGSLTLAGTTGLSFTSGDGSNDASMSFSGTAAAINAALEGMIYRGALNYNGADTLSIDTSDGDLSDQDSVAISLAADGIINGDGGDNDLTGTSGNDRIDGGAGADAMAGGLGNDTFVVDNGGDAVTEVAEEGEDSIETSLGHGDTLQQRIAGRYDLPGQVENLTGTLDTGQGLSGNVLDNTIVGGSGADYIDASDGGSDTTDTNDGRDVIYYGAELDSTDSNDAGDEGGDVRGDLLVIQGDYSDGVTLGANALVDVEKFRIQKGAFTNWGDTAGNLYSYDITTVDANVVAGGRVVVQGGSLQLGEHLKFNGAAETDGSFQMFGGHDSDELIGGAQGDHLLGRSGNDILTGNGGDDRLRGGLGADAMNGGSGADTFVYAAQGGAEPYSNAALESTGTSFDTIIGFDFASDKIDLPQTVSGIATITGPVVPYESFDEVLAGLVNDSLAPNGAVAMWINMAPNMFLVVDADGDGSYQADHDYVIFLQDPVGLVPNTPDFFI